MTDRYKLVHFDGPDLDEWELFDLRKRPARAAQRLQRPAYARSSADLKRELDRLRAELKVPERIPPRSIRPVDRLTPTRLQMSRRTIHQNLD